MFKHLSLAICSLASLAIAAPAPTPQPAVQPSAKKAEAFKPFTGKVVASKVRLRAKADLESHIVRQVNKHDLLLVVAEEGDFWVVQPPKGTKAYVFRSYVLDNVVEANRVNVRLEPHVDAPIIAQLQAGDKIQGDVCPMNHKWLEIAPPLGTRFYISKEYLSHAGGPDYLHTMEKKKAEVDELISSAFFLTELECKKSFEEMSPKEATDKFQTVLRSYADFPDAVNRAKEGLALLKDTYLQKKISYLEGRAELTASAKDELIAKHRAENAELAIKTDPDQWHQKSGSKLALSDRVRFWDAIEESLYLSWTAFHAGKRQDDFYREQTANATVLTGKVESYDDAIKNKPGDYILRGPHSPLAYLYSTVVDLEKYEGMTVTLLASPRPNNHFAFPAYFVLSVD